MKNNHVEKTIHPCQFPVELIERLVLSMTNENDWIFDPFLGTGTTIVASLRHKRRGAGAEIKPEYITIAKDRIHKEVEGTLATRPMNQPVYDPNNGGNNLRHAPWTLLQKNNSVQLTLFESSLKGYSEK